MAHGGSIQGSPIKTVARLDPTDAKSLIAGADAHAEAIGISMCIAAVDDSGQLIAFMRMEVGKVTSTTIAIDRAFTAAAAKKAKQDHGAASQPGSPAYDINVGIGGRLMVVAGGLPVISQGQVVDGIGYPRGPWRGIRRWRRPRSKGG